MKRRNNKLKYIIITIVSFLILLGLSSFTIDDNKDLNFVEFLESTLKEMPYRISDEFFRYKNTLPYYKNIAEEGKKIG